MKLKIIGGLVAAACCMQAAAISNGNFETGSLSGWTVTGNVFPSGNPTTGLANVLSNEWSDFAPAEGTYYAELSNSPNVNTPPTKDFTSITTGQFNVGAGASISFQYILGTNEFTDGLDYGEFTILGTSNNVLFSIQYPISAIDQSGGCNVNTAAPDGTTICAATPWTPQTIDLSPFQGQNVSFRFSIFDNFYANPVDGQTGDNGFDSVLLLDAVSSTGLNDPAVPEPATFVLGGAALIALGVLRRRARR